VDLTLEAFLKCEHILVSVRFWFAAWIRRLRSLWHMLCTNIQALERKHSLRLRNAR